MATPIGWAGLEEPAGALQFVRTHTRGAAWHEYDVRSDAILDAPDVAAQLDAVGLSKAEAVATARWRTFKVRNLDNAATVALSLSVEAGVAAPVDAIFTLNAGEEHTLLLPTHREVTSVFVRAPGGAADVAIDAHFDVPVTL